MRSSEVSVFFIPLEKYIYSDRVMMYTVSLPFPLSPLDAGWRFVPSSMTENLNWVTDSPNRMFVALWGLHAGILP